MNRNILHCCIKVILNNKVLLKLNRKDYDTNTACISCTVVLDENLHDRYLAEKNLFLKSLAIDKEHEEAKTFVFKMINMTISLLQKMKISEYTKLSRVLSSVYGT